jgi:hypothetical protein
LFPLFLNLDFTTAAKQEIVSSINQDFLSFPATKPEFVVYAQKAVNPTSCHPNFELNLHAGPGQSDHVGPDSADEPSYWLLLNIAMGREFGRYLHGLPTAELSVKYFDPGSWKHGDA